MIDKDDHQTFEVAYAVGDGLGMYGAYYSLAQWHERMKGAVLSNVEDPIHLRHFAQVLREIDAGAAPPLSYVPMAMQIEAIAAHLDEAVRAAAHLPPAVGEEAAP